VKLLTELAPTLGKLGYGLELHEHTDARPFPAGSVKNNWSLSFQRAESARMELEKSGVPPELIAGVYAHGASLPADKADPKAASNRRLAIFARPMARKPDDEAETSDEKATGREKTDREDEAAEEEKPKAPKRRSRRPD